MVVVLLARPLFSCACSHPSTLGWAPKANQSPCTRPACCGCDGQQTFFFLCPLFFFSSAVVGGQRSRQGRGCWCCMKLTSRQRQKGLGRVEIGSLKQRGPWMAWAAEWVAVGRDFPLAGSQQQHWYWHQHGRVGEEVLLGREYLGPSSTRALASNGRVESGHATQAPLYQRAAAAPSS